MLYALIYLQDTLLLLSCDQNVYCKITEEKLNNLININFKILFQIPPHDY